MMKKILAFVLGILLLCTLATPVLAADPPVITCQPQNPDYPEYSNAVYSVTVQGQNLRCFWFLNFNGKEYDLSDTASGIKPWEPYAGETYGASSEKNGKSTTFKYTFGGIEKELSGSYIYAVVEDGHFEAISDHAYINVTDSAAQPPVTVVPAAMEVSQGDVLDLYCSATAPGGGKLSYTWYETSSGKLVDMIAVNRGSETSDTLRCDTSALGTRYYLCGVNSSDGGSTYTSVIPVTVLERQATAEPPVITTKTLAEATVGEKYSAKLSCTDADAAFSIYQNPGKANDFGKTGLNLTQHGEIEGTPAKAGTYTFTVCAVGENGEGYMTYTLKVKEAPVPPTSAPDETEAPAITVPDPTTTGTVTDLPETSQNDVSQKPQNGDAAEEGIPWWVILIIALAAAGAGVGITLAVMHLRGKKNN